MIRTLKLSIGLLSESNKRTYFLLALVQVILSILDLVGVLLIGILVSIGIRGLSGSEQGNRVEQVLGMLNIENLSLDQQISIIGGFAAILLITKTLASAWVSYSTFKFLSSWCADISLQLIRKINSFRIDQRDERSSQQLLFAVNEGVRIIILQILGAGTLILADIFLILVLWGGLIFLDIRIALISIIYFLLIFSFLYLFLQKKILLLGNSTTKFQIQTNQEILEMLSASKEIWARNLTEHYEEKINALQKNSLSVIAKYSIIPLVGKYLMEVGMVVGTMLLGVLVFNIFDPLRAAASIAVFIAAATRVIPSLLRLQNSGLLMRGSKGAAELTFDVIREIDKSTTLNTNTEYNGIEKSSSEEFLPNISISNLTFNYRGTNSNALETINLEIEAGMFVSVIGESGSGKTTLINLILGLLEPSSGNLSISGIKPRLAVKKYKGLIAYAPQEVTIFNKNIRENVAIGVESCKINEDLLSSALKYADLSFIGHQIDYGLEKNLNEFGNNLSGGQKQRIGLARAFYGHPKLLILDESTSSVDSNSENQILRNLKEHFSTSTIIFVTHRMAVAEASDRVIYLRNGKIEADGKLEEITSKISETHIRSVLSDI
jgi:ABC-type bacteriocin/lantibiotic exporter with double-glycine peptidase domain